MTQFEDIVAMKRKEKKATKKYDEAVRHLLRTNPTLGIILLERLRPIVSYDCECYYTNGIVIGYNPDAVLSMSILNNVFVIAHEIMHNLMCHSTRRNGRDARLWNIAGDYCINSLLEKLKVGEIPRNEDGTPNCLLNYEYDGSKLSTEAVYNMLSGKVQPKERLKKSLSLRLRLSLRISLRLLLNRNPVRKLNHQLSWKISLESNSRKRLLNLRWDWLKIMYLKNRIIGNLMMTMMNRNHNLQYQVRNWKTCILKLVFMENLLEKNNLETEGMTGKI